MANHTPTTVASRAWYSAAIAIFQAASGNEILGELTRHSTFSVDQKQRDAWLAQIMFLQKNLEGLTGTLLFEFNIPRIGSRVDAVLLIGPVVFVVEFKVGESVFGRAAVDQVWDYALDLKNFHEASHAVSLVPILVATEAKESVPVTLTADRDGVYRPIGVHPEVFRAALDLFLRTISGNRLDSNHWAQAPYKPTPTIVEAARVLYAHHSVEAISCFDAGRQALALIAACLGLVREVIKYPQKWQQFPLCIDDITQTATLESWWAKPKA